MTGRVPARGGVYYAPSRTSIRIGGTFRFQKAALQSFLAGLDLAAKR